MNIRELRQERGWSQEHLAQLSGLNVRTIQRIEKGESASAESLKSLAAVFELEYANIKKQQQSWYQDAGVKNFFLTIAFLSIINLMTSSYPWVIWVFLGWGFALVKKRLL